MVSEVCETLVKLGLQLFNFFFILGEFVVY